jgi:hypothetical protein
MRITMSKTAVTNVEPKRNALDVIKQFVADSVNEAVAEVIAEAEKDDPTVNRQQKRSPASLGFKLPKADGDSDGKAIGNGKFKLPKAD